MKIQARPFMGDPRNNEVQLNMPANLVPLVAPSFISSIFSPSSVTL